MQRVTIQSSNAQPGKTLARQQKNFRLYKYLSPCKYPYLEISERPRHYFYTDALFTSPQRAREYLSIPYEPLFRLRIDPNHPDSRRHCVSRIARNKRRIWAAFGCHGGAYELMSDAPLHENPMSEHVLTGWRYIDAYCSFTNIPTEHGPLLAARVITCLHTALREFEGKLLEYRDKKGIQFILPQTPEGDEPIEEGADYQFLGCVVYWVRNELEYTLSLLARVRGSRWEGVKFYGVYWKDDENQRKRYVAPPVTMEMPDYPLMSIKTPKHKSYGLSKSICERFDSIRGALISSADSCGLSPCTTVQLPECALSHGP